MDSTRAVGKMIRPLLQEIYQDDPWKMLVCCILLNLTKRQQVDGIRHELFSKYPTEYEMMEANEDELSKILQPLGLYRKRAKTLIKMRLTKKGKAIFEIVFTMAFIATMASVLAWLEKWG